ncbi:MAG: double-strand break repair protein AddB, partial [Allosphingosinicella sp.]
MSAVRPAVYTVPPHRAFADALAAGLLARHGGDETGLARGLVLVPNNRAARAIADAFVRRAAGGLLLPRLVPIGDPELDERIGGALEPLGAEPVPPAIDPVERLFLLAGLVERALPDTKGAEALRLAEDLARTLDQLLVEEVEPTRLRAFGAEASELSQHWQASLDRLELILGAWPKLLAAKGKIDLADRRNRLLRALAKRWAEAPPAGFVVAAGVTTSAPAVARVLRAVARMERGALVLPGLDLAMPEDEWEALGPHEPDPDTGFRRRSIETHPQFHLKRLLDGIGVARGEVERWRWGGGGGAPAARSRAIAHAMKPAAFTSRWQTLDKRERRLTGVRALELADPAEEAQAIAVALREAVETPERTAALVTPDRKLARRVAAHLRRWGIEADDSAGRPLSETAPGTFLLALATAAAEQFAPVSLLALLKHPLAMKGEGRGAWLEGARRLDLALRGPRPPAGLDGVSAHLADRSERDRDLRAAAAPWWRDVAPRLRPLERAFRAESAGFGALLATLRETASDLGGDEAWAGPAGRAAADLV